VFNRRALFLLGCAILGAAALLFRLGRPPIVTSHEARLAETAVTMARSGLPWAAQSVSVDLGVDRPHLQAVNPWLIPVYEGGARLQKPPLPYWCAAAVFLVLGPSEFAARLPSAMMGMAGIFLVYGFVRELAGRRTARFAALVWVSTLFVVDEYHKAMADPYLAFFTLIALWTWMRLCRSAGPPRPVLSQRLPWVAAFYLAVALALLAKGPVALLLIAGFIAVGVFVGRRRPRLEWSAHAGGVVLVMAITLPWVLYVVMTVPRVLEVWRFESVGEFADNVRNARPWFFYLGAVFQVSLPWTALWLAGLWLALRRPRRAMLAPILWMACMIVILSFAHMKKNAYLLPLMPVQTLIAARALAMACAWARGRLPGAWPKLLLDAQAILGIIFGIGIAALALTGPIVRGQGQTLGDLVHQLVLRVGSRVGSPFALAAALAAAAALAPLLRVACRSIERRAVVQSVAYIVLIVIALGFIEVEKEARRRPVFDFSSPVAGAMRDQGVACPVEGARAPAMRYTRSASCFNWNSISLTRPGRGSSGRDLRCRSSTTRRGVAAAARSSASSSLKAGTT